MCSFVYSLVFVLIIVFCEQQLAEFKCEYIRIQAEIISVNSVCEAVNSSIRSFNYNYDDLAKIQYSKDGKVQAITTDSFKINELKADIMLSVQQEIAKYTMWISTYRSVLSLILPCFQTMGRW